MPFPIEREDCTAADARAAMYRELADEAADDEERRECIRRAMQAERDAVDLWDAYTEHAE